MSSSSLFAGAPVWAHREVDAVPPDRYEVVEQNLLDLSPTMQPGAYMSVIPIKLGLGISFAR